LLRPLGKRRAFYWLDAENWAEKRLNGGASGVGWRRNGLESVGKGGSDGGSVDVACGEDVCNSSYTQPEFVKLGEHMNKILLPIFVGLMSLVVGCSEQSKSAKPEIMTATTDQISGRALYREKMVLPLGAVLKVSLEDVSKMDVASTVIATTYVVTDGAPPYPFIVEYPSSAIDDRNQYSLRATISLNEQLLFTSTRQLDPFRETHTPIEIILSKIGANRLTQQAEGHHPDTGLAVVSVNPLAELTNTYWKLLTVNEKPVIISAQQPKEAFLQLVNNDLAVKGFAGCNNFIGSYTVKGNSLSFESVAATRKACLYGMENESKFMQALEDARFYSIHEHALTLLNKEKRPIARLEAVYFN
jgi:putative lipoprotein